MNNEKHTCSRCHGEKFVQIKARNHGTCDYDTHTIYCPACDGKGYIDQSDRDRYYRAIGVGGCNGCPDFCEK